MQDKITGYFKELWKDKIKRITVILYLALPWIVNIIIETLNRRSFFESIKFMIFNNSTFLLNVLLLASTMSITLLFKKRIALISMVSAVWIGFGVANYIIKSYRETPFSANDLRLASSVMDILGKYLNFFSGILIIALIALAVVVIGIIWLRIPAYSKKINYIRNLLIILIMWIITMSGINIGIANESLSTKFPNMTIAYKDYGFVYCFSNSVVNVGVKKPKQYSSETIETIAKKINDTITVDEDNVKTPNIIFLQLESFFDVDKVKDLVLSEEATPIFNSFKEKYPSGFLSVNNVGYGTANTEFEVLTGMNLEDFGPGEFPYKTVLQDKTCESMSYILREYGYSTHAMHNNTGSFYSRNTVFKNLGFDTYTSLEYMYPEEYTPLGWVKDKILTSEITKVLDSTDEPDFLYSISVQGHGTYPSDEVIENPIITVSGIADQERKNQFEYYVNQIHEMDEFIGDLTNELSKYDEDIVLVMYGDHLPSLELSEDELTNENLYQTEYVIWNNFNMNLEDKDVETFQLGSRILENLNIDGGVINKFHQIYQNDSEYLNSLKTLEYDILYGDLYVFDGSSPYVSTDMQMGTYPVEIISVKKEEKGDLPVIIMPDGEEPDSEQSFDGWYFVKGKNLTQYSNVFVNDEMCDTEFIDSDTLRFYNSDMESLDSVVIKQMWKRKTVLSETSEYMYITVDEDNLDITDETVVNE